MNQLDGWFMENNSNDNQNKAPQSADKGPKKAGKWVKGQSGNPAGRPKGKDKLSKLMEGKDLPAQMREAFQQTGGIKRLIRYANQSDANYRKFLELFIKLQSAVTEKEKVDDRPVVNFNFTTDDIKNAQIEIPKEGTDETQEESRQ